MKKILLGILFTFMTLTLQAAPAPFGIEMGKSTIQDVKKLYNLHSKGKNPTSQGEAYDIDITGIDFDGLKTLSLTFDKDGKAIYLGLTLSKSRFDGLFEYISGKYKLLTKQIPFVGNKLATFQDGSTIILLDAPHMSFEMTMIYIQKDFFDQINTEIENEQQDKKKREASQL